MSATIGARFRDDGIVRVVGACSTEAAAAMRDAVWRRIEALTPARRDLPETWGGVRLPSFKPIKRRGVFRSLIASSELGTVLDVIFGPGGWEPLRSGVQVLFTFPNTDDWMLPHHFWHLDTSFEPCVPTTAVKVFCCLDSVTVGGGGTLAVSGSHRLVDRYSGSLPTGDRVANTASMRRFLAGDPWTRDLIRPGEEPARTRRLMGSRHDADGIDLRVVEMTGEPGDAYVTDIHTVHCVATNAGDRPRVMLAGVFRRATVRDVADR